MITHLEFISKYGTENLQKIASSDKTFRALEIRHDIWSKDTASREGLYLRLAMAGALQHARTVHTGWYHRE